MIFVFVVGTDIGMINDICITLPPRRSLPHPPPPRTLLCHCSLGLILFTLRGIWSSSLLARALSEPLRKSRLCPLVPLIQFLLELSLQHFCPHHLPATLIEALSVCIGPCVGPSLILGEHPDSWRVFPSERFRVETFLSCLLSQLNLLPFLELFQFVVLIHTALFTVIFLGF